jgi:hypothetical protein
MWASSIGLGELALEKTKLLADELGVPAAHREQLDRALELLGAGWLDERLSDVAPFANDLTDDGTPFELSVAFSRAGVELRALAEPQRLPYGIDSNWRGGLDVHQALQGKGFDLSRFASIAWLFEPAPGSTPRFAVWHAVALGPDGSPNYKIYLNPQVRGRQHAAEV